MQAESRMLAVPLYIQESTRCGSAIKGCCLRAWDKVPRKKSSGAFGDISQYVLRANKDYAYACGALVLLRLV